MRYSRGTDNAIQRFMMKTGGLDVYCTALPNNVHVPTTAVFYLTDIRFFSTSYYVVCHTHTFMSCR